jgi:hypothetical protein
MTCDICGRTTDKFRVCSLPGFPISMNHCEFCLAIGAMPLFTAEVTMCFNEEANLLETVQKHGAIKVKGIAAEWFLDAPFWIPPADGEGPGRYMSLRAYLDYLAARL